MAQTFCIHGFSAVYTVLFHPAVVLLTVEKLKFAISILSILHRFNSTRHSSLSIYPFSTDDYDS